MLVNLPQPSFSFVHWGTFLVLAIFASDVPPKTCLLCMSPPKRPSHIAREPAASTPRACVSKIRRKAESVCATHFARPRDCDSILHLNGRVTSRPRTMEYLCTESDQSVFFNSQEHDYNTILLPLDSHWTSTTRLPLAYTVRMLAYQLGNYVREYQFIP